jgi:hypothetical protein
MRIVSGQPAGRLSRVIGGRSLVLFAVSAGLLAVLLLLGCHPSEPRASAGEPPPLMLWAWQREEDLRFLDPHRAGVAPLIATISLAGDRVETRPRTQRHLVPDGVFLLPVIRLESDFADPPLLTSELRDRLTEAILTLVDGKRYSGIQLDFDARESERLFFKELLVELRNRLGPGKRLSIAALASWCLGDDWLLGLPIDEAVPMLYRMGPEGEAIRASLARSADFRPPICRKSIGVSSDEPIPPVPVGRRLFLFHPRPWTSAALTDLLGRVDGADSGG